MGDSEQTVGLREIVDSTTEGLFNAGAVKYSAGRLHLSVFSVAQLLAGDFREFASVSGSAEEWPAPFSSVGDFRSGRTCDGSGGDIVQPSGWGGFCGQTGGIESYPIGES